MGAAAGRVRAPRRRLPGTAADRAPRRAAAARADGRISFGQLVGRRRVGGGSIARGPLRVAGRSHAGAADALRRVVAGVVAGVVAAGVVFVIFSSVLQPLDNRNFAQRFANCCAAP